MYDNYTRYIYEWLINTFYRDWGNNYNSIFTKLDSVLTKLDSILTVLQFCLHLGVFALFLWVVFSILKPHLFKI